MKREFMLTSMRRQRGFTLIELMITVMVIGVLSAVAYPSYVNRIKKSRRADATAALMSVAQAMERFGSERGTYAGATLGTGGIYPANSPGGFYTLSITTQTATAFTVRATPSGGQATDACASFTYNESGTKAVIGATLTAAQCWNET